MALWCYDTGPELKHFGILGMRWGHRNGPPYPLDESDKSYREKNAKKQGKRKTANNAGRKRHLTARQKKMIAVGAGVVLAGLAVYGAYKSGALKSSTGSDFAKQFVQGPLGDASASTVGSVDNIRQLGQPKRIKETLLASVMKTNPHRGDRAYDNNCVSCSIAGILRTLGYDVEAKATGPEGRNLNAEVEKVFNITRDAMGNSKNILDGSAVKFGRSMKDAAEMLKKRFGDNAKGVCAIQWKGGADGHAFSWIIENGEVGFVDFQTRSQSDANIARYWNDIDPNGNLMLARLDNLPINFSALKRIVDF